MVRTVFPSFYAALVRAASFISLAQRQSSGDGTSASEDARLCVDPCESRDRVDFEWHMDGLLPQGAYAPRAMTQPPAFNGYATVHQTARYVATSMSGFASWERRGSAAKANVFQQRGR
jgi:hypothetical protein